MRRANIGPVAVLVVAVTVAAALSLRHANSYFFLFDDFALIGLASTGSWHQLLGEPLFSFYRPVVFLLTRCEFHLFDWRTPSGYAVVSLILHVVNATLVYGLGRRLAVPALTSQIAASLFLLSPWAAESYLWLSCRFDLVSTLGVLLCLLAATAVSDAATARGAVSHAFWGTAAAALALAAKESAVTLPVLVLLVTSARPGRKQWRKRIIPYAALVMVVVGLYLYVRHHVLPGLAGAYGSFADLIRNADVVRNGQSHLRALVMTPFPRDPSLSTLLLAGSTKYAFLACVLPGVLVQAAKALGKGLALFSAAFLLALLPVLWSSMPQMSSAGGRFLYLPGVWFALVLGIGLGRLQQRQDETRWPRLPRWVRTTPLLIACGYTLASVQFQTEIWRKATLLSRQAITQVHSPSRAVSSQPLYIENLPYQFVEGPYVLKDYAFTFYRAAGSPVRGRGIVLTYRGDRVIAVSSFALSVASADGPRPGERVVRLQLPIDVRVREVRH